MISEEQWGRVRKFFNHSFWTNFHYALATVNPDGSPHVTPIGSFLLRERPVGVFFEVFTSQLPQNLDRDQRVCLLAVNSGWGFWSRSFFKGKFVGPPAIRLIGMAGPRRRAQPEEVAAWLRRMFFFRHLKGYRYFFKDLSFLREIRFHQILPIQAGEMTAGLSFP